MWEFIQLTKDGKTLDLSVVLKAPRAFTIGRIDADIIIPDKSVSRKHATLEVQSAENDSLRFVLYDNSKFGTFVNGIPLDGNKRTLSNGDKITFGAQPGVDFSLQKTVLNVTVSSMNKAERQRMKTITKLLHGTFLSTCTETCTFLVMPYLVVTVKVVCALLAMVPIVTPQFMEKFLEAASCIPFVRPQFEAFLPPVREERLVDSDAVRFLPNNKRPNLFKDKVFYVLTQAHFSEVSPIVRLGSGKVVLIDSPANFAKHYEEQLGTGCASVEKGLEELLRGKDACVIHAQNVTGSKDWQRVVYSALRSVRRRPILESELGFAVLYVSTNGYCNPETKCPEKLYEEAGISQAFSVNPFHLESQVDGAVLTERSVNLPIAPSRPSIKRSWPSSTSTDTSSSGKKNSFDDGITPSETLESSSKRQRKCTNIVPPVNMPRILKSECLVADSEPVPHTPENTEQRTRLSCLQTVTPAHNTLQAEDMMNLSNVIKENMEPVSVASTNAAPVDYVPCNSSTHQSNYAIDEQDALAMLNSMPSLLPLKATEETTNTVQQGSSANSLASNEVNKSHTSCSTPPAESTSTVSVVAEPRLDLLPPANPVLSQPVSSPVRTNRFPSYAHLSTWLSKNTPVASTGDDKMQLEPLAPTHAPIEMMDLVVPNSVRAGNVATNVVEVGPNYKCFKKVWPLHIDGSVAARRSQHLREYGVPARVDLTPFVPDLPKSVDGVQDQALLEPIRASEQEERDRIDRLFDQLCQIPRGRS